ncbi:MAG: Ig-like domain-containing protein [Muribaculaceae bacterium]|nr:Ig-like domain-containing protein [Muribaculaceae bacterium]
MTLRTVLSHILVWALLVSSLFVVSCANIGSPEGGPRDYTPPRLLKTSPGINALNFTGNRVELTFDEIVQVREQQKNVVVSPAQKEQAAIKSLGKKIIVEFREDLLPNTTYVVDFSDAIEDNNEGNRLNNFAFSFSTGDVVDTLQISGIVLRAKDLEPMQHVLVGVHTNLDDTAFTRQPFERIARTNDKGEFTLRGLKPGSYHIFALNDMDGDYKMSRSEDYAFLDEVIVPTVSDYVSQDTTFTFDHRVDTVMTGTHQEYLPNDVFLPMFNEEAKTLYLIKAERQGRNKVFVQFGAPTELPQLTILKPANYRPDWYKLERNATNDSIFYWITDSTLIKADSIMAQLRYLKPDSLGHPVMTTDTIRLNARTSNSELKRMAEEKKERENLQKDLEKQQQRLAKLRAEGKDTTDVSLDIQAIREKLAPQRNPLKFEVFKNGTLDVTDSIGFTFKVPIDTIVQSRVRLEMMQPDSTWTQITGHPFVPVSDTDIMRYYMNMPLKPEANYRLTVDSLAITSIYGEQNDSTGYTFKVKSLDEYGIIQLHVNSGDSAFVELLDSKDRPIRTCPVVKGTVEFPNLIPGSYYARLIKDTNMNGKWDQGNYEQHLQPEEVYYFPDARKLRVRKNWTSEETWNIYETPLNLQKPEPIVNNKPENKKDLLKKKKTSGTDDEEEDDEFNSSGFGNDAYSGNKYRDYQDSKSGRRTPRGGRSVSR